MPSRIAVAFALVLAAGLPLSAQAHFQELLPETDIVPDDGDRQVRLDLVFTHPMEGGPVMDMAAPARFGVLVGGKTVDLMASLQARPLEGRTAYRADYRIGAPGDYVFFVAPAPYWEPAEQKYIVHYTKVVVDYGMGEGWDAMVGLPVEIEPLVRPYGLWTGNQFRGIVRRHGQPVPFAEIEVEWVNDGSLAPPSDAFVTQVIKADATGQFSYVMPRAGWWGFAALLDGDDPMTSPEGKQVPVEWGALMWVRTVDMQ